ncbi:MAG: hypothetical protein V9G09_02770 [Candidatus Nanopelagicales bacterium]
MPALLILAGLVFVAVAWELFGPFGQLAILAGSALLSGFAAIRLRTRVPRTTEALAVVAFALGLIVAAAGPGLGALPERLGGISTRLYSLVRLRGGGRVRPPGRVTASVITSWLWLGWLSSLVLLASAMGMVTGPLACRAHHHAVRHRVRGADGWSWWRSRCRTDRLPVRVTAGLSLVRRRRA